MAVPSIPKVQTVPRMQQALGQVNLSIPKAAAVPPVSETTAVPSQTQSQPFTFNAVPKPPETPKYTNPQLLDWSNKQSEIFSQLEQAMKTPFTYDPNTDAALQSQRALYEAGAAQASQNAMETMNDRGILGSSITGNQLAQIQQQANTQFNALIPQYREQAYNQYQNNLAQIGQMLSQAMNLRNQQFNEGVTKAELTGTYMPEGAEQLVNSLYGLKAQAETRGITAQERAQLSTQADQIRAQLTAMGVDVSGIGADTSLSNAQVGQRTLAGRQLDYQQQADARDFNESVRQYDQNFGYQQQRDTVADQQWQQNFGVTLAQVTGFMPDGTPTSDQQQRDLANLWTVADQTGVIPPQLASIYGLQANTPTRAAKEFAAQLAISQQNANSSSTSAAASMMNAQTNRAQENRIASTPRSSGSSSSGSNSNTGQVSAKESYNNYSVLLDDMQQVGNKAKARQLLEMNSDYLTDSDYRKLADYINNNL